MRNYVIITAIMLLAAYLFTNVGNETVSLSQRTQKTTTIAKTTSFSHFPNGEKTVCTVFDRGYTSTPITIASQAQKGQISVEIEEKMVDEVPTPTIIEQSVQEVASISLEASASATPLPTQPPAITQPTSNGVLNADVLFSLVNQTRMTAGLASFEKHSDVCAVAQSRAPELDNEIYGNSYMHAGFQARRLPYWATENMISQQTEQDALNWWMNSSVHRSAILGDYKFACTACQGKSCAMIFSNLTPKQ